MSETKTPTPRTDAVFSGIEPDNRDGRIMAALRLARQLESELAAMRAALRELYAMVKGESPSLLNEDSGGNGQLEIEIDQILAKQG